MYQVSSVLSIHMLPPPPVIRSCQGFHHQVLSVPPPPIVQYLGLLTDPNRSTAVTKISTTITNPASCLHITINAVLLPVPSATKEFCRCRIIRCFISVPGIHHRSQPFELSCALHCGQNACSRFDYKCIIRISNPPGYHYLDISQPRP